MLGVDTHYYYGKYRLPARKGLERALTAPAALPCGARFGHFPKRYACCPGRSCCIWHLSSDCCRSPTYPLALLCMGCTGSLYGMGRIGKGKIGMPKAKKKKPPPLQDAASNNPSSQVPTAEAVLSSPKAQKPAVEAPPSPGKTVVRAVASIIKELAHEVMVAERKKRAAAAAVEASSELYNRIMHSAERVMSKRGVTLKQIARAEKSVDR